MYAVCCNKKTFADLLAKAGPYQCDVLTNKRRVYAVKVNLNVEKYSRAGIICKAGILLLERSEMKLKDASFSAETCIYFTYF